MKTWHQNDAAARKGKKKKKWARLGKKGSFLFPSLALRAAVISMGAARSSKIISNNARIEGEPVKRGKNLKIRK